MQQTLILIMGLPGSGKTTLSTQLAKKLDLPLISRDSIKLLIMDNIGWADRGWSKKVGKASYDILDYVMREQIKSGTTFIIESDFRPEFANEKFAHLQSEFRINSIQIICHASSATLLKRWQERAASDVSHPSNTEGEEGLKDLREALKLGARQPLKLQGTVINVDTDDAETVDVQAIVQQVRKSL